MRAVKLIGIGAALVGLAVVAALAVPTVRAAAQEKKTAPNIVIRQGEAPFVEILGADGPRLGVQIRDLEKEDLAKLKLASQNGVAVVDVTKGSAAERAGVKANDVIVAFDGENVRSANHLTRLVRETAPGRTVKMSLMREGKRVDVDVTPVGPPSQFDVLVNRDEIRRNVERDMQALRDQLRQYRYDRRMTPPAPQAPLPPGTTPRYRLSPLPPETEDTLRWLREEFPGSLQQWLSPGRARLGITVQDLTPDLAAYFGVSDGVLVSSVEANRPGAKAGLKAGDVITAIDGKAVKSPGELVEQLAGRQGEITLSVTRDKKALTLKATLDAAATPPHQRIIVR